MSRPSRRVVRPLVAPTPVSLAFVLPPVVAAFAPLPAPRVARTKRHALLDIVAITLCVVLAGAETWVDIAEFGQARAAWFRTFLELPHGISSHARSRGSSRGSTPKRSRAASRRGWPRSPP